MKTKRDEIKYALVMTGQFLVLVTMFVACLAIPEVLATERLPEEGTWNIISVAMTRDHNEPRLSRYDGEGIFSEPEGMEWDAKEDDVTHWMPLPQPPKEATL